MMGHKIRSDEEIWLIIPKLSLLPLLIWSTDSISVITEYDYDLLLKLCVKFNISAVDNTTQND